MSELTARLDEIQARCDAATPGPWSTNPPEEYVIDAPASECLCSCSSEHYILLAEFDGGHSHLYKDWTRVYAEGEDVIGWVDYEVGGVIKEADTHFIAAARTDLPKAIAALRAVSAEHAPESLDLLHPDCAEGTCDHDPDDPENPSVCPVVKTTVCAGCLDLAERAWRFYGEESVEAVEYPCPTAKAIAKALGVDDE